uniref:Nucleolar protein 16 n=1 Tax=Setaria digitata TaxID=48799 RepID=A0A915PK18_9BILA
MVVCTLLQIKEPDKDDGEKKACNEGFDETVTPTIEGQNGAVESSEFKTGKVVDDIPFSTGKVKSSVIQVYLESLPGIDVKMKVCVPKELNMNVAKLPDEQLKLLDVANLNLNDTVTKNITYAKKAKHEVNVEKKEPVVLAPQRDKLSCVQPPRERIYKLLPRDVQFCVHMIEKHGEDYEAMAKDEGNVFRDSVKGIARKIRIFKESPQYEAYLKQKDE